MLFFCPLASKLLPLVSVFRLSVFTLLHSYFDIVHIMSTRDWPEQRSANRRACSSSIGIPANVTPFTSMLFRHNAPESAEKTNKSRSTTANWLQNLRLFDFWENRESCLIFLFCSYFSCGYFVLFKDLRNYVLDFGFYDVMLRAVIFFPKEDYITLSRIWVVSTTQVLHNRSPLMFCLLGVLLPRCSLFYHRWLRQLRSLTEVIEHLDYLYYREGLDSTGLLNPRLLSIVVSLSNHRR